MGLDFNNSNAQWSYSGFNAFRRRLASEIGIDLDSMEGFGGTKSWLNVKDPIVPLLNHSDCDGELSPAECRQVAPRLRELVDEWPEDRDTVNAILLAEGMEDCAKRKKKLIFQ